MRLHQKRSPRILCQSCPSVLVLSRLQWISITLKRRQRAKIMFILALLNNLRLRQKRSLFLTILWKNPPFKRFFIKNSLLFVPFCRFL
ncbi:hypothetical protein D0438_06450 [Bacillus altitudinis]|nr:hypothetical protein D0438_06450 [Bacillus altitudinis]